MMLQIVSLSLQVSTLRVIVWLTGSIERGGPACGKRLHDVALGNDADEPAVGAKNERRADALFGEKLYGVAQG